MSNRNLSRQRRSASAVFLILALASLTAVPARAARISGERLLPQKTLAYARVPSVPVLIEAFQQTNFGRMIADPQVKPFVQGLFSAASSAIRQVREATGLSIEELAQIPQGEITLAFIPTISGENSGPAGIVAIVDCGENIEAARKFRESIHKALENSGAARRDEMFEGFAISIFPRRANDTSPFVTMERENALVFCSNLDAARQVLARWAEGGDDCLAENKKFATIMNRCRGTKDELPQIEFFVDPIATAWQVTQDNPAAQLGLAILPTLGLDGLKGVGGSMVLATEDFDSILHLHVLLGAPRSGVLELIALESGDDTPPAWVPADVASYGSYHWNFEHTYFKGIKLGDSFQGEGRTAAMLNDRALRTLGIHLEQDVLPAVTGRVILVSWFQRPFKMGVAGQNVVGIQIHDPKAFKPTLEKIVGHFGDRIERKTFSGVTYYKTAGDRGPDDPQPAPCFALFEDWVLAADRPAILEHMLARRNDPADSLAAALDYRLIASKIGHQPGGERPGMLTFNRSDEGWKYLYDLAASEQTRTTLRERSERNPVLGAIGQELEKNRLPPWEVISRYLAPEGSMMVDDESGIHYMQFSLRRQ